VELMMANPVLIGQLRLMIALCETFVEPAHAFCLSADEQYGLPPSFLAHRMADRVRRWRTQLQHMIDNTREEFAPHLNDIKTNTTVASAVLCCAHL